MLVQMVMDVKNKGIDIDEIAGDDDTTGFERLKRICPESQMINTSIRNHVKKNVIRYYAQLEANINSSLEW